MEFLFAVAIILLTFAGIGIGLMFGRRPVNTSCGGLDCVPGARCADCPNRRGGQS